jgi:hypothetical protein
MKFNRPLIKDERKTNGILNPPSLQVILTKAANKSKKNHVHPLPKYISKAEKVIPCSLFMLNLPNLSADLCMNKKQCHQSLICGIYAIK